MDAVLSHIWFLVLKCYNLIIVGHSRLSGRHETIRAWRSTRREFTIIAAPGDVSLTGPVPKPFGIPFSDWAQYRWHSIFCAQSVTCRSMVNITSYRNAWTWRGQMQLPIGHQKCYATKVLPSHRPGFQMLFGTRLSCYAVSVSPIIMLGLLRVVVSNSLCVSEDGLLYPISL